MRWSGQGVAGQDDGALLSAAAVPGLLRTTTTPEFAGLTFHEVLAKSALSQVPAMSAMPFRWTVNPYRGCSHACSYCLEPSTPVLMADGRQRPIGALQVGDAIIGTEEGATYRHYVRTTVLDRWQTVKRAHRVTLADGTTLVASGDHRFLTRRGWKHVTGTENGARRRPHLTTNDELLGFGALPGTPRPTQEYGRGYLAGMVRGDAHPATHRYEREERANGDVHQFRLALVDGEALDRTAALLQDRSIPTHRFDFSRASEKRRAMTGIRTSRKNDVDRIRSLVAWPDAPDLEWRRGFLAGIFDAEGGRNRGILRIHNCDPTMLDATQDALEHFGFSVVREDLRRANGICALRVTGGLRAHLALFALMDPAISRKRSIEGTAIKSDAPLRVVSVDDAGVDIPMIDITTGTGDFIANGVVSHNCYARHTHSYLDLDTGSGFDREIVVKTNVGERLAVELAKPTWQREHVALGTNTDPYQRAEGRYRLMPPVLRALHRSGTPFSVLTKGTLLRRDLPLLAAAARDVPVGVGVSIAVWDEHLHRSLEPGTPSPRARLDLVRAVRDAGLPCGVFLAPVLPHLTDTAEHLDAALADVAAAGATGVTVVPLHLRPGAREHFARWVGRHRPDLVPVYRELYRRGAYLPRAYRESLAVRLAPLLERHGYARSTSGELREGEWPEGSLPPVAAGPPSSSSGSEPAGATLF